MDVRGVLGAPPRDSAAERAPRRGAIRRKTGYGADSGAGSRFVERMPTAAATRRRLGRDALGLPTACLRARLDGTPAPSLLA
ncbi:MAG TPA: hypothetical protein VGH33_01885 [Isosphaeraceae bacterium]